MRKTDKKIENQLVTVLTEVCEHGLKQVQGFQWLTHAVNYQCFPQSLVITLVFDSNVNLDNYLSSSENNFLLNEIRNALAKMNVKLSHPNKQLIYDTEENCEIHHAGNWAMRLDQ